ncbi:M24 family metallopeptidase [Methanococcus aeolicus]|uniref:M24 family metallopeptidase n=1 Tax=Methanococcus aeolicus TaxID=42879 RepID=UPI0036F381DF
MAIHKIKEFMIYLIRNDIKKAIILKKENINYFLEKCPPTYSYLIFDVERDKIILKVPEMEYQSAIFHSTKYISVEVIDKLEEDFRYCNAVEDSFPVKYLKYIDKDYKIISDKLNEMKSIKNPDEIELIKKAAKISDKAIEFATDYILNSKKPITENQLAGEIEYIMKKEGSAKPSFDTIAISDKKTAQPHGAPSNDIIKNILLMDIGATVEGYCSDITRTIILNQEYKKYEKFVNIYNIVNNAKKEAENNLKAGISVKELDKIAREEMGEYNIYFTHSLGHGVGTEIHERPSISQKLKENIILKENMVITLEPAIYLDNFGVRIEDLYVVKKNGFKKLSNARILEY